MRCNKRMSILRAAAMCALYRNNADDKGGSADDPPADKHADKGKKKEKTEKEPEKISLTREELDAQIKAAVEKVQKKHQEEAETARKNTEAETAKKQGEFEKLYNSEVENGKKKDADIGTLKMEIRKRDASLQLRDYLAEKHSDYIGVAKYIIPTIEFSADTEDAELETRIKAAADQYVKDNPRAAQRGAPEHHVRGTRSDQQQKPVEKNEEMPLPSYARSF